MCGNLILRLLPQLSVALGLVLVGQALAEESVAAADPRDADRHEIEAAIESYVAAFNAKDVDKLVSHWSPDGVYISRTSGDQLTGHASLKEEFTAILSPEDAPNLAVETESIEFVSPNVAIERGSALISRNDSNEETTYQVVYVAHGGTWLIDRVSEDVIETKASNYERLNGLEFLVGQWINEGDGMIIDLDCQWTANQNYLSRKYHVSIDGDVQSSGLEIIGWDAKNEQIRSWLFDSDGGFVKGEWNLHDRKWVVQSLATLADGASGSSTNVLRPIDEDTYSWRKFNRVVDGQLLPNTEEVTLRRR
ncbi:SnoaL-like domain protein [Planctomycetes bacterium CA13]|uniref:SnoaL-like domain protein n=1 Tax=Novipirellula herctigrandis TaxID=2527986 RepID=A0A5C5YV97_9BACT|nr:SnoaL-like domain protein [Planctomycetes bacterium CA13]